MPLIAAFAVPHPPLIIPEVGNGSEKTVKKTIESYKRISREIAKLEPETIIISSPHTIYYKDCFYVSMFPKMTGSFERFGASNVKFEENIDVEFSHNIIKEAKNNNFPIAINNYDVSLDHGTMVPLYYIRKEYPNCKIVVVGLSMLSLQEHLEFGKIISKAISNTGRKVIFVASGDLSHKLQENGPYGFCEEGPIYDKKIIETLSLAKFSELLEYSDEFLLKAKECGHPSFTIMSGVLSEIEVKPTFYSHEDITGVGYGLWSFYPNDEYVKLARDSINSYVTNNIKISPPDNMNDELKYEKKGAFVSIHKKGKLRGCIGTILPAQENLALEIIENAILASSKDYRFSKIEEEELNDLEISVDVLTPPEDIKSTDELDPKKYGIIVVSGFKKGVLLPDIEGVNTKEEQILIALKKANIKETEDYKIKRFRVIRHR